MPISPAGSAVVLVRAKATPDQPLANMRKHAGQFMPVAMTNLVKTSRCPDWSPALVESADARPLPSVRLSVTSWTWIKPYVSPAVRPASQQIKKRITKERTSNTRGKSRARQSRPRVSPQAAQRRRRPFNSNPL